MAHVVAFGVEFDELPFRLHEAEGGGEGDADADALEDKVRGFEDEDAAHGGIAGAEGFEEADGAAFLENHDEERGDDGDSTDDAHNDEYESDVAVEKVEPGEEGGVGVADGVGGEVVAVVVGEYLEDGFLHLVQLAEIVDQQLVATDLVAVPVVEFLDLPDVADDIELVDFGEVGVVDAGDEEGAGAVALVLPEIGAQFVAHFEAKLACYGAGDEDVVGR